jgi:hypothetical protein
MNFGDPVTAWRAILEQLCGSISSIDVRKPRIMK